MSVCSLYISTQFDPRAEIMFIGVTQPGGRNGIGAVDLRGLLFSEIWLLGNIVPFFAILSIF